MKTVLSVLCFGLFGNVFILKTKNKNEKENGLTNKALHYFFASFLHSCVWPLLESLWAYMHAHDVCN
jgi:hypothetical protein